MRGKMFLVLPLLAILSCTEKKQDIPIAGFYYVADKYIIGRVFKNDMYIVEITNEYSRYKVKVMIDDFRKSSRGESVYFSEFYYTK